MEALEEANLESERAGAGLFAAGEPPAQDVAHVPASTQQRKFWPAVEWLPIQIGIAIPVRRFCVRDLLALDPGQIIATTWSGGEDLPLSIDDVQLAWVEMEAVDQEMAIRITRLL